MITFYPWQQSLQTALVERFSRQHLHHALLLYGQQGAGIQTFSVGLAEAILCDALSQKQSKVACGQCQSCLLHNTRAHPDLHQIQSEKQIGVDAIREAIEKLQATAHISQHKVLVVHAADSMTEAAANALLKTLEEPPLKTFLLLTVEQQNKLLPTILSRCEKLHVQGPQAQDCLDWLHTEGFTDVPQMLLEYYATRPLLLKQQLEAEDEVNFLAVIQALEALKKGQLHSQDLAAKWQNSAEQVAAWLLYWLKRQAAQGMTDQWWSAYRQCRQKQQQLAQTGTNKLLVLTQLLAQLRQVNDHVC